MLNTLKGFIFKLKSGFREEEEVAWLKIEDLEGGGWKCKITSHMWNDLGLGALRHIYVIYVNINSL